MTVPSGPPCDGCGEEPGLFMIIPPSPGVMGNFGYLCLLMLGLTSMAQADLETLDEAVKAMGYQVSAAEKKKRKDAEIPEVDGSRTIAEIVETGPRDEPPDNAVAVDLDQAAGSTSEPPADELTSEEFETVADYLEESTGVRPDRPDELPDKAPF